MNQAFERFHDVENEPLDITGQELATLLDAGLIPTEIDRLRFTRWRLHTHQLEGDCLPQEISSGTGKSPRQPRWAGRRGSH